MEKPSVVVVGAGGMGALFGAILQEGGLAVTLVDTNAEHVAAMKKNGLKIIGRNFDFLWPARSPDLSTMDFFLLVI